MENFNNINKIIPLNDIEKETSHNLDSCSHGSIYSTMNFLKVKIDFSSNINPLGISRFVLKEIKKNIKQISHIYPDPNCTLLKKSIAHYIQNGIDQNWINIGNGATELIHNFVRCYSSKNSIIPSPTFCEYELASKRCKMKINYVPLSKKLQIEPDLIIEKVKENSNSLIFFCNPNNPTGYLYSREELEALKALCLKYDLFLFSDEAYREFCYDGREFISPLYLDGIDENVVVIDTVSKRYSACGARLGCIITKNKEVIQSALKFAQARLSPGMVEQIAGTAAVDTPDSYFEEVNKEYTLRRDTLVKRLNAIEGVFCPNPGGAFYVVAKLPIDDADQFCQWILESFTHNGATVMMAPATGFYSTEGYGKNEVRMAYVLNTADLNSAMDCLDIALKQYPGRTMA